MNVFASIYATADTQACANSRKKLKIESLKRLNLQSQAQYILGISKPFKKKDVGVGRIILAQVQVCMTMRKSEESPNQQILFHGE